VDLAGGFQTFLIENFVEDTSGNGFSRWCTQPVLRSFNALTANRLTAVSWRVIQRFKRSIAVTAFARRHSALNL